MKWKIKQESKSRVQEEIGLYLLGFLAARSEIAGLHPFAAAVFAAATFLLLFMLHEQKQINENRREHHKKSDRPPPAEPYPRRFDR